MLVKTIPFKDEKCTDQKVEWLDLKVWKYASKQYKFLLFV